VTPPSPAELATKLAAKQQIFDGVVRFLVQQGRLARLPSGLYASRESARRLDRGAARHGVGTIHRAAVPRSGSRVSRKWAIPLLEHWTR
jgi:hypothetical protein